MIIGIDYSMNSVGICIYDANSYKFYSYVNTHSLSKAINFDFAENVADVDKNMLNSLDGYKLYTREPNKVQENPIGQKKKNKKEKNRKQRASPELYAT